MKENYHGLNRFHRNTIEITPPLIELISSVHI